MMEVKKIWAEEIAALQNEKELADEHLRLDTITWEKALKKREEEIAALTDKLHSAHQYYNIALDEWQHCVEEIAELRAELESHVWKVSPAMAQAKIDLLNEEIAALKEELKEAYSKNEKLLLFANRIAKEGQHDLGSNKLCDCVLCRIIQGAAKECI